MIAINEAAVRNEPTKASGLSHLRFRGDGIELDLDFATGEDCRVALEALGDYFARRAAPVAEPVPPVTDDPEPSKPESPEPRTASTRQPGRRMMMLTEWFAKQTSSVNLTQIMAAFPGEWPSGAAVYQFFKEWVARPSCPIERASRGLYRLKGGGAPIATTPFRGAGGSAPAASPEADPGEVGASCA